VNILVADDHDIVRLGLHQLLSQTIPNLNFSEVATGRDAVKKVEEQAWDIVILDLNLPDIHGLDALKQIKLVQPTVPVIILSLHPVEQFAMRAYKAGASAYLAKDTVTEELIIAIHQVVDGHKYISLAFSQQLADQLSQPWEGTLHDRLSDREMEILCRLAKGQTPSAIAKHLFLSPKTISSHRARILRKLRLTTTPELMKYAIEHKLTE